MMIRAIMATAGAALLCAACVKRPIVAAPAPSQAFFPCERIRVWNALVSVVQYDLLLPVETKDEAKGILATREIREPQGGAPTKYRLSATVRTDEGGTSLRFYKDLHRWDGARWALTQSTLAQEKDLLDRIRARIEPCAAK